MFKKPAVPALDLVELEIVRKAVELIDRILEREFDPKERTAVRVDHDQLVEFLNRYSLPLSSRVEDEIIRLYEQEGSWSVTLVWSKNGHKFFSFE